MIRALWAGETVMLHGQYITVDEARLYTLPPELPLLLGAVVTPETARWVAGCFLWTGRDYTQAGKHYQPPLNEITQTKG